MGESLYKVNTSLLKQSVVSSGCLYLVAAGFSNWVLRKGREEWPQVSHPGRSLSQALQGHGMGEHWPGG